jgi:hypothetical protein
VAERLGEILVKQGACSEAAVRDALKNQIIFGGRLGTNLLELQAVTEEALAKALGMQHGLPSLHGPQTLDPAAVALVTSEVADRCDAIPFLLQDRRLALVVVDPRNLAMLDEVAFVTGRAVHPIVAPESRVWALLKETYAIDRHLRGIEIDFASMRGRVDAARSVPTAAPAQPQAAGADLMDEGEFSALYETVAKAPARPAAPPAAESPRPPAAALPAPPAAPQRPVATPPPGFARPVAPPPSVAPPPAARAAPPAAPIPTRAAPPAPPRPPDDVIELTDLLEPGAPELPTPARPVPPHVAAEVLAALAQAPGHAPPSRLVAPRPPEPEPSPLSFAEAVRFLEGVSERDAIARTVLRYARSKFKRAVLLTVHRGAAHGWAGLGERLGPEAVRRIHLALGLPGIVDTVVRTQAHFLGPLPKTESNVRLLKALGGGVPGNALLMPILALGRVVNLFYADAGKGGTVDSGDVGELLILATRIAKSYDTLLERVR